MMQSTLRRCLAMTAWLVGCHSAPPTLESPTAAAGTTATATSGAAGSTVVSTPTPVGGQAATPPGSTTLPIAGAAGTPVAMAAPSIAGSAAPIVPPPTAADAGVAADECGITTQWKGDQYCIKPPPVDKGFQVHVGPSDYSNPGAKWILQPGMETTENFSMTTGNTKDVYYYWRQYRMRPGSHHMIMYANGNRRLGGAQNLSKDDPQNGVIAPENSGVGMKLAANTPLTINLHYLNYTDAPILKEVWINFWYRDPKDVTEPANELFSITPMNVAPGTHVIIHSDCAISQPGRIVTLYGHRHANNQRFSAWRVRGATKDLIFDDYNWEDPLSLEYSSVVTNPAPNPAQKVPGGWTGPLDLMAGDHLTFECDIVNMTTSTFVGQNEAKNDEMCILVGDTVQTTVPGFCTSTTMLQPQ